jgi:iron complex transport system substrate-binding protein
LTPREKAQGAWPHEISWGFFVGESAGKVFVIRRTARDGRHAALRHACACLFLAAARAHAQQSGAAVAPAAPPAKIEFTDEVGRKVFVPQPVRRIVSLAPSLTETIFALGAQDRLVGVTDYCDYPPEALTKPKVGGAINPSLEQIVALRPDLVLATKSLNRRETVLALEQLGIAAYATDPHTVEDVIASAAKLAAVIGAHDAGAALEAGLRARLSELKRRVGSLPPKRVLFVVWVEPLISVGRDTFIADAMRWAGAESVVQSSQSWPHVSLEEAVRLQPHVLVFASSHSEAVARHLDALAQLPGWRNLEAARNRRFVVISDAFNRPAPRLISAIEQLARQLHPDAFAEPAPSAPTLHGLTAFASAPNVAEEGSPACAR